MLLHYLRSALASLKLRKQTTLINVIGLTLGFTCFIVAHVLAGFLASADRHFANIDRIYMIQQRVVAPGDDSAKPFFTSTPTSLAEDLRTSAPELEAVARWNDVPLRVGAGDRLFPYYVRMADPEILRIFRFAYIAGDASTALDEPASAIVTQQAAEMLFGTRDAMGRTFELSRQVGRSVEVIVRGIVEESSALTTLRFPSRSAGILVNNAVHEALVAGERGGTAQSGAWSNDDLGAMTYVLLPADGSLAPAELDRRLAALAQRIDPGTGNEISLRARALSRFFDDQMTWALSVLGIVTGLSAGYLIFLPGLLILAMACYNYINLTVAIAATRAKEIGMSKVLGASTRQVIQQHLAEAAAAVVVGFGCALVLAALFITTINNLLSFSIPYWKLLTPAFWLAAALVMTATTLIAGAYPAWVMSRFKPIESLRVGAKRGGSSVLRSVFIGGQFAMASVLLTAVLVMYAQNAAMRNEIARLPTDPYVQIENSLIETPDVDPDVLRAALLASPAIRGVTGMADGFWTATLATDPFSRTRTAEDRPVRLRTRYISYDFFSTLGIELAAGRSFERERDSVQRGAGAERGQAGAIGIVIESATARQLGWRNPADAVGQTIYQRVPAAAGVATREALAFEVLGVVDKPPLQAMSGGYTNVYRLDPRVARPIVRIAPDDVAGALAHISAVWRELVPTSPLRRVRFLDETLEEAMFQLNMLTTALLSIVVCGFLVALAGIFGMALFVANRRRHEIGVRKSLGANTRHILGQLLVEFGKPVLVGNVLAWPLAYLLAQLYVALWLERMPLTPWPYLLSLGITLAAAWLGVGRQALRAARLQPARVLRYE